MSNESSLSELRSGWRTLAGATLGLSFAVISLPFYTAGLFLAALHAEFGWSITALSFGTTLFVLGLAMAAPVVGILCDRFGERRLILPGMIVQVTCLVLLSKIETLSSFYILMASMSLLGSGCAALPYVRIVNRNFDKMKGTALGVMITGAAGISALAPPLVQHVISGQGWRSGYLAVAVAAAIATPCILLLLGKAAGAPLVRSHQTTAESDFCYSDLFRDPAFYMLAVSMFLIALSGPGLIIHFSPMLIEAKLTAEYAALMVTSIGITQTVARLFTGVMVDRFFAPRIAMIVIGCSSIGFVLFAIAGPHFAVIGAIAAGCAYGAEADLLGYLTGRYFPKRHFGRVFGVIYSVFLAGTAGSPLIYGIIVDWTGSYTYALVLAAGLLATATATFALFPRFPITKEVSQRELKEDQYQLAG